MPFTFYPGSRFGGLFLGKYDPKSKYGHNIKLVVLRNKFLCIIILKEISKALEY